MDRQTVYVDEIPLATEQLLAQRYPYEGLGLLALDIFGTPTAVSRLPCTPTSPASLVVNVGPGAIYSVQALEPAIWGQLDGIGGLGVDATTDHQILKQGLSRATQSFTITPPVGVGQSMIYLIEAQFQEADAGATNHQFYNTADPTSPATHAVSPTRQDICALQLKAGIATTGTPACPAADSGWVPVWAITVAYGQTTITSAGIALAPGAPFVTLAVQTAGWSTISGAYTAQAGNKLIADTSGAAFTLKLPVSPAPGSEIQVIGDFYTNNLTVDPQGATIDRVSGSFVLNKDGIGASFIWAADRLGVLKWWIKPAGALS